MINLGFMVVDRFLRVSVATRVGSDTAKLSRTVNRAFFEVGRLAYLADLGRQPDDELVNDIKRRRDDLSSAVPENADPTLIADLALAVDSIDNWVESCAVTVFRLTSLTRTRGR